MTNQDVSAGRRSLLRKPLIETLSLRGPAKAATPVASAPAAPAKPVEHEPRDILNSIRAVVYNWDLTTDRICWGANVKDVLGKFSDSALECGDSFADLVADNSESSRYHAIVHGGGQASEEGAPYRAQYGLLTEGRDVIWVEDFGRWFADASGGPGRAHGVVRIIADPSQRDDRGEIAKRDPLTGAVGRGRLIEHINAQCAEIARRGAPFAVLIVGIDRLAALNERFGYETVDGAIVAVSRRLHDCVRATDIVARYLGGRFALVLDTCDAEQCALLGRRILQAAKEPIRIAGREIRISLRIGAALAPKHGRSAQALLQRAEEAYDFSCRSRGGVMVFTPALAARGAEARLSSMSDEIVAALNERRVVLAYQPVAPARGGRQRFYEALLRIREPGGAFLGPSAILPVAERVGLIAQLDQRVLELALKRMSIEPDLRLSINASPATMIEPDWIAHFANALAAHPGVARRLILEVTESQAIADLERTARLFEEIRRLGVKVAMDDFGAGHTSFRNLRRLGVDIVKIDGAFVQNIARSADDRFFVRTLLELARNLNVETVAEWVEDAEAARILIDWGVDYLQGHHFGAAEPQDEALAAPMLAAAIG
ncbi:MAG TPA: bifunctional diguanylate cyclase/phosphodiesterase [Roseiarcus sp.]|nr:bifunctional diguanylate cyclase/phosphodiesterase [Roseiarcus sp.]